MRKFYFSRILLLVSLLMGLWAVYLLRSFRVDSIWQIGIGLGIILTVYFTFMFAHLYFQKSIKNFNHILDRISSEELIGGVLGLLLALIIASLTSITLSKLGTLGAFLSLTIFILASYLGLKIGTKRLQDIFMVFPQLNNKQDSEKHHLIYKVVDTSAIIDGRIYDVCLSEFLEGSLLVPTFVIEELQHIADSSDNIRRNKGRRGLDLLAKMQKHPDIRVEIIDSNKWEDKEVDQKLICLCKELGASIITNDYNLNKVAELQGIKVLNINELTNAVKMIIYPGESMYINIIKEGKEAGQGIGYLEDGTMVVVEDARKQIGHDVEVVVTSVFQTAAGRMIFTRRNQKEDESEVIVPGLEEVHGVNIFA